MKRLAKANGYETTKLLYAGCDGFPRRVYKKDEEYYVAYMDKAVNVTKNKASFIGEWRIKK